jgi:hypothetical protein
MPSRAEYDGNLTGRYGTWRGAGKIAREQHHSPIVQAAAYEEQLRALDINPPSGCAATTPESFSLDQSPRTRGEYAAIANRHLARLRALLDT